MIGIVESILTGAVWSGTPILYGTLGEILVERAGIVNLGVEGSMVMGACVAFITTAETQDPVLGVIMGALAGGLVSLIHAFMVVTLRANQIASGLALMFLCLGITSFIGRPYVGVQITGIQPLNIPGLSEIPLLGRIMFEHDVLVYLAYLSAPLLWLFLVPHSVGPVYQGRRGKQTRSLCHGHTGEGSSVWSHWNRRGIFRPGRGASLACLYPELGGSHHRRPGICGCGSDHFRDVASVTGRAGCRAFWDSVYARSPDSGPGDKCVPLLSPYVAVCVDPHRLVTVAKESKRFDARRAEIGLQRSGIT